MDLLIGRLFTGRISSLHAFEDRGVQNDPPNTIGAHEKASRLLVQLVVLFLIVFFPRFRDIDLEGTDTTLFPFVAIEIEQLPSTGEEGDFALLASFG